MTHLKNVTVSQLNRSLELASKEPASLKIKNNGKVYVILDIKDAKIKTPIHDVAKAIQYLSSKTSELDKISQLKSSTRNYCKLGAEVSQIMENKGRLTKILYEIRGNSSQQTSINLYKQLEEKSNQTSSIFSQIKEKAVTDIAGITSVIVDALKDSNTFDVDIVAAFALMSKKHPKETSLAVIQGIKERGMDEPGTVSSGLLNDLAYFIPKAHRKDYINIEFPEAQPKETENPVEEPKEEIKPNIVHEKKEPTPEPITNAPSASPPPANFIDNTVQWAKENPALSIPLGVAAGIVAAPFVVAAGAVGLLAATLNPLAAINLMPRS